MDFLDSAIVFKANPFEQPSSYPLHPSMSNLVVWGISKVRPYFTLGRNLFIRRTR